MSMSDCPACWETPCVCGREYMTWSRKKLREFVEMLQKILREKEKDDARI